MEILYTKNSAMASRYISGNGFIATSTNKSFMTGLWESVFVVNNGCYSPSIEFKRKLDAVKHAKKIAEHYNLPYVTTF